LTYGKMLNMEQEFELTLQGRRISAPDIETIRELLNTNPNWNRTFLSKEICRLWNWRRGTGEIKDMACRSLLRKLEQLGYIHLPKGSHRNESPCRRNNIQTVLHSKASIDCPLPSLYPIEVHLVERGYDLKLFKYFISAYHYLGWSGTVGENLKYLFFDVHERPLGCMMFGAAAWKIQPRDIYIGWDASVRERNLLYIVNNNRFLVLPWVRAPHLASHLLGKVCRRLDHDWQAKYNHPVYLAETFVEQERFKGTCYKAANWAHIGQTQGRGKLDRKKLKLLAVKDIWVYPLDKSFREKLCR
jgi:hypothetical protein